MLASVIIITKNQKGLLEQTLPTLIKQKFSDKFEILIVDSGSTDGALAWYKKFPVQVVEYRTPFNYAKAFNLGATFARGTYLIRLSGDCIPIGQHWLQNMIEPFTEENVGGVFGKYTISNRDGYGYPDFWPRWRFPKEKKIFSVRPVPLMGVFGMGGASVYELAGGCCAIRRSLWEKRGFNDYLISAEDAEYAWFLHLLGYDVVYTPHAEVIHEHKINRVQTVKNYLGLNTWHLKLEWEILRYWIVRFSGNDPYEGLYYAP